MHGRALFLVLLTVLAGCQTAGSFDAGEGPLTLDYRGVRSFEMYAAHEQPLAFAVSEDGKVRGYSVCNQQYCGQSGEMVALDMCKAHAKGSRCRILAVGDRIVWRGPIHYEMSPWLGESENDRPVVVYWDVGSKPWGSRDRLYGVAKFRADKKGAALFFPTAGEPKFGACNGVILGSSFTLTCDRRGTVTGSFAPSSSNLLGGHGSAQDTSGRIAELTVLPRSKAWRKTFQKASR